MLPVGEVDAPSRHAGLADGRISIAEASTLAGLVKLKRELELDDLSERVEQIEGTVVGRVG